MFSVTGIPSTRISNLFARMSQQSRITTNYDRVAHIQQQISTGYRYTRPGEEPVAAGRAISLQRQLEQKDQYGTNIEIAGSYLAASDTALMNINDIITSSRVTALGATTNTISDDERDVAVSQISMAINNLFNIGNQEFRNRNIFAGSLSGTKAFSYSEMGYVQYDGNEKHLNTLSDLDTLLRTSFNGDEVFSAISTEIRSKENFEPQLDWDTLISDFDSGNGVELGSIQIAAYSTTSAEQKVATIDLSGASNVADLARIIENGAPDGVKLDVTIGNDPQFDDAGVYTGIDQNIKIAVLNSSDVLNPSPDYYITIDNIGSDKTAKNLGILQTIPVFSKTSKDCNPALTANTPIENVAGTKAETRFKIHIPDNDLIFRMQENGDTYNAGASGMLPTNGILVTMEADAAPGMENVEWDALTQTYTVHTSPNQTSVSTLQEVVATFNADPLNADAPKLDLLWDPADELGLYDGAMWFAANHIETKALAGGAGERLELDDDILVTNGGKEYRLSFDDVESMDDLLNVFNQANAGLIAEINEDKTGFNVRSRLSATDFGIAEYGGVLARQLGLDTFHEETLLSELRDNRGVRMLEDEPDFEIVTSQGTISIDLDIGKDKTIQDVLDKINAAAAAIGLEPPAVDPENPDPERPAHFATLKEIGNGFVFYDTGEVPDFGGDEYGPLQVRRTPNGYAAWDLGILEVGEFETDLSDNETIVEWSSASFTSTNVLPATDVTSVVVSGLEEYDGTQIVFTDAAPPSHIAPLLERNIYFDEGNETLTFYNINVTQPVLATDPPVTTYQELSSDLSNTQWGKFFELTPDPATVVPPPPAPPLPSAEIVTLGGWTLTPDEKWSTAKFGTAAGEFVNFKAAGAGYNNTEVKFVVGDAPNDPNDVDNPAVPAIRGIYYDESTDTLTFYNADTKNYAEMADDLEHTPWAPYYELEPVGLAANEVAITTPAKTHFYNHGLPNPILPAPVEPPQLVTIESSTEYDGTKVIFLKDPPPPDIQTDNDIFYDAEEKTLTFYNITDAPPVAPATAPLHTSYQILATNLNNSQWGGDFQLTSSAMGLTQMVFPDNTYDAPDPLPLKAAVEDRMIANIRTLAGNTARVDTTALGDPDTKVVFTTAVDPSGMGALVNYDPDTKVLTFYDANNTSYAQYQAALAASVWAPEFTMTLDANAAANVGGVAVLGELPELRAASYAEIETVNQNTVILNSHFREYRDTRVTFDPDPDPTGGGALVDYDVETETLTFYDAQATDFATYTAALAASEWENIFEMLPVGAATGAEMAAVLDPADPTGTTFLKPADSEIRGIIFADDTDNSFAERDEADGISKIEGWDSNGKVTHSIFTALDIIRKGIADDNVLEIEYGMDMLDETALNLNYSHSELGVELQNVQTIAFRHGEEKLDMEAALAIDREIDYASAATNFYAALSAYQASLQVTNQLNQMSLLNYI